MENLNKNLFHPLNIKYTLYVLYIFLYYAQFLMKIRTN